MGVCEQAVPWSSKWGLGWQISSVRWAHFLGLWERVVRGGLGIWPQNTRLSSSYVKPVMVIFKWKKWAGKYVSSNATYESLNMKNIPVAYTGVHYWKPKMYLDRFPSSVQTLFHDSFLYTIVLTFFPLSFPLCPHAPWRWTFTLDVTTSSETGSKIKLSWGRGGGCSYSNFGHHNPKNICWKVWAIAL